MYITIDRKVIRIDEEPTEEERKRVRNAIIAQNKKLQKIEQNMKRRGFCLNCHTLLTIYGKCDRCGTIWKFHTHQ